MPGVFASQLLFSMRVTIAPFLFLSIIYARSAAQLSAEEKQDALDLHNDLRRGEGASNMLLMVTQMCVYS